MSLERLFKPTQPPVVEAPLDRGIGKAIPFIVFGKNSGAGTGQASQELNPAGQPPTEAQTETPKINLAQPGITSLNEGLHETDLTQAYDPGDHFGSGY